MKPRLRSFARRVLLTASLLALSGCDMLGIESAATTTARKEAEGKAIGAGCRHVARSIEQCYTMNKRADKAAVFAGWREMNDYMRENNIEAVPAPLPPPPPVVTEGAADEDADKAGEKGAEKGAERASDKAAHKGPEKRAEKAADGTADKAAAKAPPKKT